MTSKCELCGGQYSTPENTKRTQTGSCPHCGQEIYIISGYSALNQIENTPLLNEEGKIDGYTELSDLKPSTTATIFTILAVVTAIAGIVIGINIKSFALVATGILSGLGLFAIAEILKRLYQIVQLCKMTVNKK